jgi:outer membrane protein OmpA-like peptidoglycan-associated protein
MKTYMLFTLPLVAALALSAIAQQGPADQPSTQWSQSSSQTTADQQSAPSQNTNAAQDASMQSTSADQNSSTQSASSEQNMSAHQPLQPELRQGFWGKINPFARKKYVQRQLSPIRNRVNELDDLTAANAKSIRDVDARAQEGIRQASAQASEADRHAVDAGNRAQQANETALQASTRLNAVEQVVGNIDQYRPAAQTEIRFRPGQTVLSSKAKQALDDMTTDLKDQKGYIVEVQGFSASRGQAGIQSSQAMANSVVRYLVEKGNVPVYRVFMLGLGNASMATANEDHAKRAHGNRVEVSLLKNNVDQLASMNQPSGEMGGGASGSNYGSSSDSSQPASAQPSNGSSMKTAPAY